MTDGGLALGLYALFIASLGFIGIKIVEHRRARRAEHIQTPAE